MANLDKDSLAQIFQYLPTNQLTGLSTVSKGFNAGVENDFLWKSKIENEFSDFIMLKPVEITYKQFYQDITSAKKQISESDTYKLAIQDKWFEKIVSFFGVNITGINDYVKKTASEIDKNLKRFSFYDFYNFILHWKDMSTENILIKIFETGNIEMYYLLTLYRNITNADISKALQKFTDSHYKGYLILKFLHRIGQSFELLYDAVKDRMNIYMIRFFLENRFFDDKKLYELLKLGDIDIEMLNMIKSFPIGESALKTLTRSFPVSTRSLLVKNNPSKTLEVFKWLKEFDRYLNFDTNLGGYYSIIDNFLEFGNKDLLDWYYSISGADAPYLLSSSHFISALYGENVETFNWLISKGVKPDEQSIDYILSAKFIALLPLFEKKGWKMTHKAYQKLTNIKINPNQETGIILAKDLIKREILPFPNKEAIDSAIINSATKYLDWFENLGLLNNYQILFKPQNGFNLTDEAKEWLKKRNITSPYIN